MPDFTPPSRTFILAYLGSCLGLVLLGIGCFRLDAMLRTEQRRLEEWPSTQGTLYLARVVRQPAPPGTDSGNPIHFRPEVAYVVTFLCTEKARHITGQVIQVDGGQYI